MAAGRYSGIQDRVILNRFREAQRGEVKKWVDAEYAYLWNFNDFSFKHVTAMESASALTVTASDNTPTLPTDFADAEGLYNDRGDPLDPLEPEAFERFYRGLTSTGEPAHYTVVNRTLYLGPTPSRSATYNLAYRRKLAHLLANGTVTAGPMSNDDDQPMWTSDHDEILVSGARMRGKIRAQDPTWQADEQERDAALAALLIDFAPSNVAKPTYARDPL